MLLNLRRTAGVDDRHGPRLSMDILAGRLTVSPSARQLVRQDGGVTAPRAGRGRPGWPMAAHQLASAYPFRAMKLLEAFEIEKKAPEPAGSNAR